MKGIVRAGGPRSVRKTSAVALRQPQQRFDKIQGLVGIKCETQPTSRKLTSFMGACRTRSGDGVHDEELLPGFGGFFSSGSVADEKGVEIADRPVFPLLEAEVQTVAPEDSAGRRPPTMVTVSGSRAFMLDPPGSMAE